MKKGIILFSFLIISQFAFSQIEDSYIEKSQNTVIAKSGLRMRSAPNLQGKKIVTIPFGQTIEVLSELSFGKLMKGGKTTQNKKDQEETNFIGDWVKVFYKGKTGYVCNAFLYYSIGSETLKNEKKRDVNQDIVLLVTGINCINNTYKPTDFHWYGLSPLDNSSKNIIKPVTVDYKASYQEGLGYYFQETSVKEKSIDFIIGSKTPINTSEATNDIKDRGIFLSKDEIEKNKVLLQKHNLNVSILVDQAVQITLERDGKQQIINLNENSKRAVTSEWVGDIDGDGKSDFIISYGEESIEIILYLSSKAEGEQLVKPVAIWYSGYCC